MRIGAIVVLAVTALLSPPQPTPDVPPALAAMADAECAFAATARDLGVRDAFLKFFAADAMVFEPDPVIAREGLLNRPSVPFADEQLTWEPRLGDIAASGELGWLTGPAAFVAATSPNPAPRHINYLSVWRRQPDGAWRVLIDVGVGTPGEPPFAPGFHRFSMPERWVPGAAGSRASAAPLAAADRALNVALAERGLRAGYAPVLLDATRFHREGTIPVVGRAAILESVAATPGPFTGGLSRAEAAKSADLGFSYGSYSLGGAAPESGTYLRIWQRSADGVWRLAVDLARPHPAK
jgi:ketosteroid isomerase-like protein